MLLRTLLALAAGGSLTLAFEPAALRWVTPLCLAALVLAVRGLPARRAWWPGLVFGAAFMGLLQHWMTAIGTDAWIGISLVEAAFFAPLGSAMAAVQRLPWWPWWTAAAWVAVESVRIVWPFSGMPWGRLSFAVADTWWAQALPYVGFAGVSFLLALTGSALAWLVAGGWRRPRLAAGAALGLLLVTAAPALAPYPVRTTGSTVVAVVQPDVPGDGINLLAVHREVTANLVTETVRLAAAVAEDRSPAPDLVLWPENSTAVDPFSDPGVNDQITTASQAIGVPILLGGIVDGPVGSETVLNQGIVWRPGVGGTDRYTKWHPVPFGEYIPWRGVGPMRHFENFGRLQEISRDMPAGRRADPLMIAGVPVGDAICFDVAYDDGFRAQLRRGAQLLTVQTSNAAYIRTRQVDQQFEITRLRALASGRALAVSSTNGISGIVSADGSVTARLPIRTRGVLVRRVPLATAVTPGVMLGPWPGRALTVVALLALGVAVSRSRPRPDPRGRRGTGEPSGEAPPAPAPALEPRGRP